MVPTRCTRIVEARNEVEAVAPAVASDWTKHKDTMSGGEGASFDRQPFAEEIAESPLPAWVQPVRANESSSATGASKPTEGK